jgi:hypothetical protein
MAKEDAGGVGDDAAKKINSVDENLKAPETLSQSSEIKEYGIKPLRSTFNFSTLISSKLLCTRSSIGTCDLAREA